MNQKLSNWASIAEIASGIAVVLTLLLLVFGINRNTEVTQASMFAGIVEGLNSTYYAILPDPELRRIWAEYVAGPTPSLSEDDLNALVPIIVTRANLLDTALSMWNADLIGENAWDRIARLICREYGRSVNVGVEQIVFAASTEDYRSFVSENC